MLLFSGICLCFSISLVVNFAAQSWIALVRSKSRLYTSAKVTYSNLGCLQFISFTWQDLLRKVSWYSSAKGNSSMALRSTKNLKQI